MTVGTITLVGTSLVNISCTLRKYLYFMYILAVAERAVNTSFMLFIICMTGSTMRILGNIIPHTHSWIGFRYIVHRTMTDNTWNAGILVMIS